MNRIDIALKLNSIALLSDDATLQMIKPALADLEKALCRVFDIYDEAKEHKRLIEKVMDDESEDRVFKDSLRDFRIGCLEQLNWMIEAFENDEVADEEGV